MRSVDPFNYTDGMIMRRGVHARRPVQFYRSENYKKYKNIHAEYKEIDIFMNTFAPLEWKECRDFNIAHVRNLDLADYLIDSDDGSYNNEEFKGHMVIVENEVFDNNQSLFDRYIDISFMYRGVCPYKVLFAFKRSEDAIRFFDYNARRFEKGTF